MLSSKDRENYLNCFSLIFYVCAHIQPGNFYLMEKLITVDLFVLDFSSFYIEYIIYFFAKQATLMRRSIVLSRPPELVILDSALAIGTMTKGQVSNCLGARFQNDFFFQIAFPRDNDNKNSIFIMLFLVTAILK